MKLIRVNFSVTGLPQITVFTYQVLETKNGYKTTDVGSIRFSKEYQNEIDGKGQYYEIVEDYEINEPEVVKRFLEKFNKLPVKYYTRTDLPSYAGITEGV